MIKRFFRQEGAKLKEMNFTEKRQYIWEYYKLHIIASLILLVFAGSIINNRFINPPMREYLYVVWQAYHVMPDRLDSLSENLSVIVEDPDRYAVFVHSYVLSGEPQMDQALFTRFSGLLSLGQLHIIISSRDETEGNAMGRIIKPVHDFVAYFGEQNPELKEEIEGRVTIFTFTDTSVQGDTEVTDAMAISLAGAPLLEELGFFTEDLYLNVVINAYNYYEIAKALTVMFQGGGI